MIFFNKFNSAKSYPKISVIILAAGNSNRFSSDNKIFYDICGYPLIYWTLKAFDDVEEISEIIVVTKSENIKDINDIRDDFSIKKISKIVCGGSTRQKSCFNGIYQVSNDSRYVLIHDAARPCIHPLDIKKLIEFSIDKEASILAKKSTDTVKAIDHRNMTVDVTLNRDKIYFSQTPQMFSLNLYKKVISNIIKEDIIFTDDSQMFEYLKIPVSIIESDYQNPKLTFFEDTSIVESIILNRLEGVI